MNTMERGKVDIKGVTTRVNNKADRRCTATGELIGVGQPYERVMRLEGNVESYSVAAFQEEFGDRELYGD